MEGSVRGAGHPSAITHGSYIFLYYTDWNGSEPVSIHLARSSLTASGETGSWEKFKNGAFADTGIRGDSDPVIPVPGDGRGNKYAAMPGVTYNHALKEFMAVFETNTAFYLTTSLDGIVWSAPKVILEFPHDQQSLQKGQTQIRYPSLLSFDQPNHTLTSGQGFLYYAKGRYRTEGHTIHRRPFSIK